MLETVAEVLFPLRCPGCGRRAAPVCSDCASTLRPPDPARPPRDVDAWCAPFAYDGVARELVARVKYRHARAAVPWLAAAMVSALEERAIGDVDVVTWPPTTPARRRHRGFDHARVLAVEVAGRLRRPAAPLLVRQGGDPQTGRPALQRRTGGPRFVARSAPERVLLVDDHHGRHAGRSGRSPPPGRLRLGRGGYRDAHSTTALSGRTIHHPGVISRHAVDTARTVLHRAARSARGMGPS